MQLQRGADLLSYRLASSSHSSHLQQMLSPRHASLFARLGVLSLVSITAFLLTAHYKLALPDDHPYGAQRNLGRQAVSVDESLATGVGVLNVLCPRSGP